jgi:hypothetical protein
VRHNTTLHNNPAQANIQIDYQLANTTNAVIAISNTQSANLYPLSTNNGIALLNITNLITGNYMVMLIQNGLVLDVKPLIKN